MSTFKFCINNKICLSLIQRTIDCTTRGVSNTVMPQQADIVVFFMTEFERTPHKKQIQCSTEVNLVTIRSKCRVTIRSFSNRSVTIRRFTCTYIFYSIINSLKEHFSLIYAFRRCTCKARLTFK